MIRDNIQVPLQRNQIRVIVTSDGVHALTLIVDESPDLVLLNEKLPRQDGYHVCQIVRKNLQLRDLPIIVLREKKTMFDQIRGQLAGVTASLTLPMDGDELVQVVKKYLNE